MASYQDIDTRLKVVEEKLDFVMKAFSAKHESGVVLNLLELYHAQRQGLIEIGDPSGN